MGRKMVKMTRITNEKTRITTYKKRKACLFKKANEFSTLCGVDTCLIVYGPNRAGEEMVLVPELWPKDESKVRDILSKYRDTASSSCTKTYTIQECLEKSNIKIEKVKYSTWDKKLEKCSLNELYSVFMALENKIQEASNRQNGNQTFPSASQLGLCNYNQQCFEQHQLFPMSSIEQNGFSFSPVFNQMSSNTADMTTFSNVAESGIAQAFMIANGQNFFCGSSPDGQYTPMVQRAAYMEPIQWDLGNNMFNNVKQFTDFSMKFDQVKDMGDSGKFPM